MTSDYVITEGSRKAPRISVNKLGEYMTAPPVADGVVISLWERE
jgi:hypothetical protein